MSSFNFSWLIEGEIAGSAAPKSIGDLEFLRKQGVVALVRLTEYPEIQPDQVKQYSMVDYYQPVPDFIAPTIFQIERIINFITKYVSEGKPVAVSCYEGRGRTGTILACYLVSKGIAAEEAIKQVRNKRPGSIETKDQEDAIELYYQRLKKDRRF